MPRIRRIWLPGLCFLGAATTAACSGSLSDFHGSSGTDASSDSPDQGGGEGGPAEGAAPSDDGSAPEASGSGGDATTNPSDAATDAVGDAGSPTTPDGSQGTDGALDAPAGETGACEGSACDGGGGDGPCEGGACEGACVMGAPCGDGGACEFFTTACTGGGPACVLAGAAQAGTACGTDSVCNGNGACVACTAGVACHPDGNPCVTAMTSCATGGSLCNAASANVADGTSCGTTSYCLDGACKPLADYGNSGFTACNTQTPWSASYLFGLPVQIPSAVVATALAVTVTATSSHTNAVVALYTNTAMNKPGTLVASTPETLLTDGANEIPITPVSLAAGTYWIMTDYAVITTICTNGVAGGYDYATLSFGSTLPSTYPSPEVYSAEDFPAYYVVAY